MSEYRSYTEQMTVLDGDSDFRRCLKPSALFRDVEQGERATISCMEIF